LEGSEEADRPHVFGLVFVVVRSASVGSIDVSLNAMDSSSESSTSDALGFVGMPPAVGKV
jgi:hypothetical protein